MVDHAIYPRVLIVAMGRINAADTSNDGLLLRNFFGNWPRENLAQIYSSGDTGDAGFFGSYFKLGPKDRRFGRLFYRLKIYALAAENIKDKAFDSTTSNRRKSVATWVKKLFVDAGLYEFPPASSQCCTRYWLAGKRRGIEAGEITCRNLCIMRPFIVAKVADPASPRMQSCLS